MKTAVIFFLILFFSFQSNNILSQCFSGYDPDTIETPNDTKIIVCEWNGDYEDVSDQTSTAMGKAAMDYWGDDPYFDTLEHATNTYNCHAWAWHVSEGGNNVWMYTPDDDIYWIDGSYVKANESEASKVSYGDCDTCALHVCWFSEEWKFDTCTQCNAYLCDHSATVSYPNGYFISKWGNFPLIKHHKYDTPYVIQPEGLMYFKKCREVLDGYNMTGGYYDYSDCCQFILKNGVVINNTNLIINTKGYDDYTQVDEYIKIEGSFYLELGSTLEINCD